LLRKKEKAHFWAFGKNHAYGRWFTYSMIALIITTIGGTILKSKLTMIGLTQLCRASLQTPLGLPLQLLYQ